MVDDTWHAGELELQQSVGLKELMAEIGAKVIRSYMPDQHRSFFHQLPFIVVGSVDGDKNVWVGIRSGGNGFIESPEPSILQIKGIGVPGDPVERGIKRNGAIGLLGIELDTKRRNRVNGLIIEVQEKMIEIEVNQSFGNCPKYIEEYYLNSLRVEPGTVRELDGLSHQNHKLISSSERFFVASFAEIGNQRQVDVSHRGGKPGFVEIDSNGWLKIPDYVGNNFFATLGNILLNAKAGLTFIDFDNKTMLQMTGEAFVLPTKGSESSNGDAPRYWRFKPVKLYSQDIALN